MRTRHSNSSRRLFGFYVFLASADPNQKRTKTILMNKVNILTEMNYLGFYFKHLRQTKYFTKLQIVYPNIVWKK